MRSYSLFISFINRDPTTHYFVEVYRQPLHRFLIARLYHWYDMNVFKVPGFRKFEQWHHRRFGKGDFTYMPITARQDIKCYFLERQDKEFLAEFEVDEATYNRMK